MMDMRERERETESEYMCVCERERALMIDYVVDFTIFLNVPRRRRSRHRTV